MTQQEARRISYIANLEATEGAKGVSSEKGVRDRVRCVPKLYPTRATVATLAILAVREINNLRGVRGATEFESHPRLHYRKGPTRRHGLQNVPAT
jgi:hypothetical protein